MSNFSIQALALFDRRIFWTGGKSVRYLVIQASAHRPEEGRRPARKPLNIALAIDASGSMSDGKLEAAKEAALGLANRLTKDDRLTVVSFASDIITHLDAVPVNQDNLARIRSEIARLETRGMTCLSEGWFTAVDCAARAADREACPSPRVIVLSDGHANEGIISREELSEHAKRLRELGVATSTLGIGDGYDEDLLRRIAEHGGGRLHDAEHSHEIASVLLGELDDIYGTVIEDATCTLEHPSSVSAELVGTGRVEKSAGSTIVHFSSMQNGIERNIVFRISCPAASQGSVLDFQARVSGRSLESGERVASGPLGCSLSAAAGPANKHQERDIMLSTIVARMWSAQIVSTAAAINRDGDYAGAEHYVTSQLRHFEGYVVDLPEGADLLRNLRLLASRARHELSPRMRKEMVLQSAVLMESRSDRRGSSKASWSDRLIRGD